LVLIIIRCKCATLASIADRRSVAPAFRVS
jgi:hypothetical protein